MQQIVYYFWQICLLKAGPERIPGNWFVLGFTFTIYFVLSLLTMLITQDGSLLLMISALMIGVGVEAGVVFGLLLFKQVPRRFNATLVALLGTTTVILIIMLPANIVFRYADLQSMRVIAAILFLATFVWRLAISGSILSKAASVSLLQGAAIMFGTEMIALSLNRSLLSSPG
jgi:hypothetical protein